MFRIYRVFKKNKDSSTLAAFLNACVSGTNFTPELNMPLSRLIAQGANINAAGNKTSAMGTVDTSTKKGKEQLEEILNKTVAKKQQSFDEDDKPAKNTKTPKVLSLKGRRIVLYL